MAEIAQLGERQTEDLKVLCSIPGLGRIPIDSEESVECLNYLFKSFELLFVFLLTRRKVFMLLLLMSPFESAWSFPRDL